MSLHHFSITYREPDVEPETWITIYRSYWDTESVSGRLWAEDTAYALADKGPYEIKEINHDV